jgi:hypothetical protein
MFNTKQRQLRHLQKQLDQALEKAMAPDITLEKQEEKLASAASSLGIQHYTGRILQIGRYSSGSDYVWFAWDNSNYGSPWPKWAFELAQSALLYRKKVIVFANGQPTGSNLMCVIVLDRTVD